MPTLSIMTFNVENLLARFNFRKFEEDRFVTLLDVRSEEERQTLIRTYSNVLNDENRLFTSLTLAKKDPEVVLLQEVEDFPTLKSFHDRFIRRFAPHEYAHKILIDGNDPRGIDVAALSRFRIASATTNQQAEGDVEVFDKDKGEFVTRRQRIFRRDCLEVRIKKSGKILPIYACHFKSMSGGRDKTRGIRLAEAKAVRRIIEEDFDDPATADWVIAGDLNDYNETDGQPDDGHGLGPLVDDDFSVDLVKRIADPLDRWTHYYSGEDNYHQLDYVLVSPALAEKNANVVPEIIRNGQPYRASRYQGDRWPRVGYDRPKASDHCPVVVELEY